MKDAGKDETKHFAEPTLRIITRLCANHEFKQMVNQLRDKWSISKLADSVEEGYRFWDRLCEIRYKDSDSWYEGSTPAQQLKSELQALCQHFGVVTDMWTTLT